ncbi:hypothetical protein [Nocardia terpenica]|uniref:hypothetical protein n=1 Tax=Nocardia terpenica TaxID=455432 RepID=UPI000ADDD4FF|nr:hypothetical protein [Nocardia terpenica]NQE93405.1 hypothetical protein [Nocardia terpenica]
MKSLEPTRTRRTAAPARHLPAVLVAMVGFGIITLLMPLTANAQPPLPCTVNVGVSSNASCAVAVAPLAGTGVTFTVAGTLNLGSVSGTATGTETVSVAGTGVSAGNGSYTGSLSGSTLTGSLNVLTIPVFNGSWACSGTVGSAGCSANLNLFGVPSSGTGSYSLAGTTLTGTANGHVDGQPLNGTITVNPTAPLGSVVCVQGQADGVTVPPMCA